MSSTMHSLGLIARMVLPVRVTLKLRAVEVDIAQVACTVPQRLIIEVARRRMTALTARGHSLGPYLRPKLDHGNKTVSVHSVALFGAWEGARSE